MPKTLKQFSADRGILLDAFFTTHAVGCEQCCRFNAEKPATAALMCLEGAVLYKRDNPVKAPRVVAEKGENFATKAEVRRAMKYRE